MKSNLKNYRLIFILGLFIALFVFFGLSLSESHSVQANTDSNNFGKASLSEIKEEVGLNGHNFKRVYSETGNVETYESPMDYEYIDYFSKFLYSNNNPSSYSTFQTITNPFTVTTIVDSVLPIVKVL
jgi:hypothetical protein